MTAAAFVAERLEAYSETVRAGLDQYLPQKEPRLHYRLVADYPRRGGRMLRPSLCLAVAGAFGAPLELATPTAVAIELMHNAFLVHDDIEDGSTHRRGSPSLHNEHGVATAINVGDALAILSFRPLIDNLRLLPGASAAAVLSDFERMAGETIEGQAIELGWRQEGVVDVGEDDYLHMVLKKTCWYTVIFPCRAGAAIGAKRELEPNALVRFGFFLGAAFQIQDDLLNLVGDPERYGKEIGGDIQEGKRTLPFVHLRDALNGDDRLRLEAIYRAGREGVSVADVAWVIEQMHREGSIETARTKAHALAGDARHEFEPAFGGLPDSPHRRFIECLCEWVIART